QAQTGLALAYPEVGEDVGMAANPDADRAQGLPCLRALAPALVHHRVGGLPGIVHRRAADSVAVLAEDHEVIRQHLAVRLWRRARAARPPGEPARHDRRRVSQPGVVIVPDVVDGKLPVAANHILLNTTHYRHVAAFSDGVDAHAADLAEVIAK